MRPLQYGCIVGCRLWKYTRSTIRTFSILPLPDPVRRSHSLKYFFFRRILTCHDVIQKITACEASKSHAPSQHHVLSIALESFTQSHRPTSSRTHFRRKGGVPRTFSQRDRPLHFSSFASLPRGSGTTTIYVFRPCSGVTTTPKITPSTLDIIGNNS